MAIIQPVRVVRNPRFPHMLRSQIRGLVEFFMVSYTDQVRDDMRASSPAGRTYVIGGRVHQASAPGQPPAIFSGDLIRSIDYAVREEPSQVVGAAGTGVTYSADLEYGTYRILPRPVWRPAIPKALRTFRQGVRSGKTFVGRP